jgi:probable rRNA maturation factor
MPTLHLRNTTHLRIRPGDVTRWVNAAARALDCPAGELSVSFCGDTRCIRYNRAWFGRGRTTDVMAFPLHEDGYWGDILINLRQAERQARRFGIPFEEEVRRLVIHGLLHLHGYDHTSDQGEMEALQEGLMGLKAARRASARPGANAGAAGCRKPSRVPAGASRAPSRRGALKKAPKASRSSHRP